MGILVGRGGVATAAMAVALAAVLMAAVGVRGDTPSTSCASKLSACALYLASDHPPANCCTPLKDAVENELSCLCALYDSPEILKGYGINVTQALLLPTHCGFTAPACSATPPTTPATSGNDAHGLAWIGMSGLASLLLFLWSILA